MKRQLIALAIILTIVLVQQFAELPGQNAFTNSLTNAMHMPMFAGITAILLWLRPKSASWQTVVIVLFIALTTEALQYFSDRQASLSDIGRDAAGMIIALVCLRKFTLSHYLVLAVCIACMTFFVPAIYLLAYDHQAKIFPTLYQPEDLLSAVLTVAHSDTRLTRDHPWPQYLDRRVLAVTWNRDRWPGIHLAEPVENWAAYRWLMIDVYNIEETSQPLTVGVRHHLRGGTSRYLSLDLEPGHNRLQIELSALAKLDNGASATIRHVLIYTTDKHAGKQILLGRIWLADALDTGEPYATHNGCPKEPDQCL